MLGETAQKKTTYLNIKDGTIVKKTPSGVLQYTFVEGSVEDVYLRQRTFNGEAVPYWYIDLKDVSTEELYTMGFYYGSNVFKNIILKLASTKGVECVRKGSPIRIEPYMKNGYGNVKVTSNGERLEWVTSELPPIETINVGGGKMIKDQTERMRFIESLVQDVRDSLPSAEIKGK